MGKTVRNEVTKFPDGGKFVLNMRVALKLTWQNMENINVMVVFYIIKNLD